MVRYGDISNGKHATLVTFMLQHRHVSGCACMCACVGVRVCMRMRVQFVHVYAFMHACIFRCFICSGLFVLANNGVVTDKDGYVPPQCHDC